MRAPMLFLMFFLTAFAFWSHAAHSEATVSNNRAKLATIERKAKQGDTEAQYHLGLYYYNSTMPPLNALAAKHWFSLAAKQGHAPSMYSLSLISALNHNSDPSESHELFLQSAQKGYAVAQYNLGYSNERGDQYGRHLAESYEWYSKAADQNCPEAQLALGYLYVTGHGVAKDESKANQWYQRAERIYSKAAGNGDPESQEMLAIIYDVGLGVAKDADQARAWYLKSLASRKSDPNRLRRRDVMDHERAIRSMLIAVLETRYLDRISFKQKN